MAMSLAMVCWSAVGSVLDRFRCASVHGQGSPSTVQVQYGRTTRWAALNVASRVAALPVGCCGSVQDGHGDVERVGDGGQQRCCWEAHAALVAGDLVAGEGRASRSGAQLVCQIALGQAELVPAAGDQLAEADRGRWIVAWRYVWHESSLPVDSGRLDVDERSPLPGSQVVVVDGCDPGAASCPLSSGYSALPTL
jgi:hypothetical protein